MGKNKILWLLLIFLFFLTATSILNPRILNTKVFRYHASLQLLVKEGKAWVRLYIPKSISDSMMKPTFAKSWVAVYKSSSDQTMRQKKKWVRRFTRNAGKDTDEYMAYDYNFDMDMSPEMEACFFLFMPYSSRRCCTGPYLEVQPLASCEVGLFPEPNPQ